MTTEKFHRDNLRYVVECQYRRYYVYYFGKSLYVKDHSPELCHYTVKSAEDLTLWIERKFYTRVTQVILEKDWDKLLALRRVEKQAAVLLRNKPIPASEHLADKKAFMKRLPAHKARLVGG